MEMFHWLEEHLYNNLVVLCKKQHIINYTEKFVRCSYQLRNPWAVMAEPWLKTTAVDSAHYDIRHIP